MGLFGNKKSAQLKRKTNVLSRNISEKGTTDDFKRKKSKVGKTKHRSADNATSVSFKSKRVQLTGQSILVERDGATVLSSKGKTLAELHRLLKHPTPKVVCGAVAEIRTIAKSLDPAGIEERVSGLCLLPLECLLSSDVTVRKELLRLVDIVLTCLSKGAIMTFGSNLCAYATAALNSLEKGIQIDGVSFLNLLLRTFPQILVPHAESLISVLTRLMEPQQYLGCSKITGALNLRWSAAKSVLLLLCAVNEGSSPKVEEDMMSDNEGCGGNFHAGCPSLHVMRAKRLHHFGTYPVHSQHSSTTFLAANQSRRESVNLFAAQQPFMSILEWGGGEKVSRGKLKVSLQEGCVIDLIARLTDMYMELGSVATRDTNLHLITACQIAQELIHISPDRSGDFSFGLFQWVHERQQPNSRRLDDLTKLQGGAALSSPSGDEPLDLALCRLAVACPQNMPKITKELCDYLILHTERMTMSPLLTKEQASKISDIIKEALSWHSECPSRVNCLVRALSSRFLSEDPCSIYFAPILCQVGRLALREKEKRTFEEGSMNDIALSIVKHMPKGLTLWLKKKDGSENSSSCAYAHIASGLRIVVEANRRGILETEEKTLKSLLRCLFSSRVFLAFPSYFCVLCVSLVASCPFAVLESCLSSISGCIGRMCDSDYSHTRGLLLDTLSQRNKGLSPQQYLKFLISALLGRDLEAFFLKPKSHKSSSDLFLKMTRVEESVKIKQHQGIGLSSCAVCVRDDIVNDVCRCLCSMYEIVKPSSIMLDAMAPVIYRTLECSVEAIPPSTTPSAPFIILRLQCFRLASKMLLSLPVAQLPPPLVETWASSAASAMSRVRWKDGGRHTEYSDNDAICGQLCLSDVLFDMLRCFPHAYHQLLSVACIKLDDERCDLQEEAISLLAGLRACVEVTMCPVNDIVSQGLNQLSLLLWRKADGPDWGKLLKQSARSLAADADILRQL